MKKTPFFSIIIATYNRAHTIRTPIDSILNQTFEDWELIIVDDGSTDDTKEIVLSYNDPRIRYVWQENQKESASRNHGMDLAQGEWICFQDSDDEYLPQHLEILYQGIHNNPDYKVIKSGMIISKNGEEIYRTGLKPASKYDSFPFECFHTTAFHKSVCRDIHFNEQIFLGEDFHFLLKVGQNYPFLNLPTHTGIHNYNPHSSNITGTNYASNLSNQKLGLDDILTWNTQYVLPYIKRKRCLNPILLLSGHIRNKPSQIPQAILQNIQTFLRFPGEYVRTWLTIVYVKIGEWTGFYQTPGRFLS
ncbi:MAG: glycosyltransferase family 2 protein [Saprospiraceae bacterium]|nr:MAG: family 2 glycosyl transferase [Bacteroidetes bacterium OLB9]MCO6462781.1 glycosyltransferase family 2 protein [Saprospiraceae bacterium]MCZ2338080.1 glycosyltransferase [Chitinophagales bacterium]